MKCYYHGSDLDGHCSGALVKRAFPECEMIPVDYKDRVDFSQVEVGEEVWVVDFSFPAEDMRRLMENNDLMWFDHHAKTIDDMPFLADVPGDRDTSRASCESVCLRIHGVVLPAVQYLGRYDVWDHDALPGVLEFQYGMRLRETHPGADVWDDLLVPRLAQLSARALQIRDEGEVCLKYQRQQDKIISTGMAYEAVFEGLRAIVMNRAYISSMAFEPIYDPERHDIMIFFGVKPGEIKYSLRSDKPGINCAQLAARYGGGGHPGAAGFYTKELIL